MWILPYRMRAIFCTQSSRKEQRRRYQAFVQSLRRNSKDKNSVTLKSRFSFCHIPPSLLSLLPQLDALKTLLLCDAH